MRVLIDGVVFQSGSSDKSRLWMSLLSKLALGEGVELFVLDRGNAPPIEHIRRLDFPSYVGSYTAADSLLIQEFCDQYAIDVFSSTGFTTATTTAQVQIITELPATTADPTPTTRSAKEQALALSYAGHFACFSRRMRDDLLARYPAIAPSRAAVTYCGVASDTFNPQASLDLPAFRAIHNLEKPYVLAVGSPAANDQNAKLLFDALRFDQAADFDVVCLDGESPIDAAFMIGMPPGVRIKRLNLSHGELAVAYSGAMALVYPPTRPDAGLPFLEAIATGCPVITTDQAAFSEVAGEAALRIGGSDPFELLRALAQVRKPAVRADLIAKGMKHAEALASDAAARLVYELWLAALATRFDEQVLAFHRQWRKLRVAQSLVDVGID